MNSPLRARCIPARFSSLAKRTSRTVFLLLTLCISFVAGSVVVRGQSALDGFDPNANGAIRVIVMQPDGKILIGGEFTTLAPNGGATVTRNHIARLNPDGTLDLGFDPNANGSVHAIAVQSDGKIVVGGNFSGANSIGGQTRNFIARLDATTGAADSFDPNANLPVFAVAMQSDGKIVVGGLFNGPNSIGGQARNFIARLDAQTGAADSFDPNANSYVISIFIQPNGRIVVGGDFNGANSIGGQTRNHIGRLDPATGLADSFDPNANGLVLSIAQEADGKIIAGGDFSGVNSIGGQTRNFIARLDPVTGLADSFDPNASSVVFAVAVQPDGKILAGGDFNTIGGQTRSHMARLDPASGLADSYDPSVSSTVFAIAVEQDDKVVVGGDFTSVSPIGGAAITRNYVARMEIDGRLDQTLNRMGTSGIATIALQADGRILIGGVFSTILGVARNNIARLNTDGTLDPTFYPNANGPVYAIAVQMDGKILVGGFFTAIGGQMRDRIARLDGITGLADPFDPNANSFVESIAVQLDGRVLVVGDFTSLSPNGGAAVVRNHIARLNADGTLDMVFDPNANGDVYTIAVQADGNVLVGGDFFGANCIGGQTRNFLARLDATTGLADSFDPNASNAVQPMVAQTDGRILTGGFFLNIGGQMRHDFARLDPTTGLADSFDPNPTNVMGEGTFIGTIALQSDSKIWAAGQFVNIGGQVRHYIARLAPGTGLADSFDANVGVFFHALISSIATQTDGKILATGNFTTVGGEPRDHFARLTNDTAALQNLSVTQNAITWERGGSSPLLTRVTFEYSSDNVNYTPLGNGVATGSNWTVTGLSLPTAQNLYVRARGCYTYRINQRLAKHHRISAQCFLLWTDTRGLAKDPRKRGRFRYRFAS